MLLLGLGAGVGDVVPWTLQLRACGPSGGHHSDPQSGVASDVLLGRDGLIEEDGRVDVDEPIRMTQEPRPHLIDRRAGPAVTLPGQALLIRGVGGRQHVHDPDDVGVELALLLQLVGEQLLAHELVERLGQHVLERDDVRPQRSVFRLP